MADSTGRLRVVGSAAVTPAMLRLTLAIDAPHLPLDPSCPNLVLRLSPPADVDTGGTSGARPPSRTYTIRRLDAAAGTVDIDVVLHGDGLFVRWARDARPGDTIDFTGPRPHAVPSFEADALVMLSDETGLPAVAAILEAASPGLPVLAVVEVPDAGEEQVVESPAVVDLRWLHRDRTPAGTTGGLERAARSLPWPAGAVDVWVAGETSEVRAVRRFAAAERGVARDRLHAFGYWRRGRAGSPS
ncbi:siderophore-interacting protein [Jiangella asiatica]|uniref:siderophore-interacting protein n=1 Tax=Jiangella asiatica TaxID=2530372 RepID=UPI0013A5D4DF|nr:siderophore-interacting protein [Jiangella asiatica]